MTFAARLVKTVTTLDNIECIRQSLQTSKYVLLQGQIGVGKTLLANVVAEDNNMLDTLLHINVDDTFDSKDLLGKFTATDVPGAFEWTAGPLTCAVKEGRWVLMEDIDLASFDVFSVLLTLLETNTLFIADKNVHVSAHPNFKIIATQQVIASGDNLFTKKVSSIPNVEHWSTVMILPPSAQENMTIVLAIYPRVPESILGAIMIATRRRDGRPVSLREILQWAARVSRVIPDTNRFVASSTREMIYREAIDTFVARLPPSQERDDLSRTLAQACEVSDGIAETMTKLHKPQLTETNASVTIGRVELTRLRLEEVTRDSRIVFSQTQHSMSLLEKVAGAVLSNEPVLLTGETGVGKTFIVQYLADKVGQELIVHNLNQQTDTSDFMGGWKPQDIGTLIRPLAPAFENLFRSTFNAEKNRAFLDAIHEALQRRLWEVVIRQFLKGIESFTAKRRNGGLDETLIASWEVFSLKVHEAHTIVEQAKTSFMFKFEEGSLVRAWREGHWILLDEVNLATNEVLERVSAVLGDTDKLFVSERGDTVAIPRHPNFRVFANMNPPTDVGKKELPPALRSKFTEFYVDDPFSKSDLCTIVQDFIGFLSADAKVNEIATFFLECIRNARTTLCDLDGESQPPHFSLRTLTRSLTYVRNATSLYGFHTALYDGLMLGFATPLQRKFHPVVEAFIAKNVFNGKVPAAPTLPRLPDNGRSFIPYQHIWLEKGPLASVEDPAFIVTPSVACHLKNLARAVFAKRPVLLEGPTSAGKSSMVQYLANLTGHKFVRINNHESTEVQEYIGHYISDEYGKLRFVDGILVDAVRNGHWVVLDELNLAPTEVLEALNRLLDDNCELFISDTQEMVKPHPNLRIFATQNPAGIYGGRKLLSRAFRNRFLEITVDDIPTDEIKLILCQRFQLATTFADKMVEVMKALQIRRQSSHLFAGKHGYITPRDLFRWGERLPTTYQELAEHGFLLLAERCRKVEEKQVVKDVVETIMKVEINEDVVYSPEHWSFVNEYYKKVESGILEEYKIVWTPSMRRLFTVVGICLWRKEPVLLVGETGSSKTTICQLWANLLTLPLHILNCHQHSEAADFLGGLRPVPLDQRTDALFSWSDGPLVRCMREGSMFVLDEISLAEDSVLERLNSVLEPSRSLTLAEKSSAETVVAHELFRVLATMNPGGDFGKKELSPALRNRFTEIYVRPTTNVQEVEMIVSKRLNPRLASFAKPMASLLCHASQSKVLNSVQHMSIRDVVGWTCFMNAADGRCDDNIALLHGLDAVILDGCSVGAGQSEASADTLRRECLSLILKMVDVSADCLSTPFWDLCEGLPKPEMPEDKKHTFFFDAPTTKRNLSKLLRALIMPKAVLLEGSPGVGKTSIVEALGCALGRHVVRINLSDQTDIMDLFGTFLPGSSDSSDGPSFSWCDGVLLRAVKAGHWVILDELNLASQSVLEGLNALLDHRSTVYIPELCQEVKASDGFRVFACQNPLLEGGGRKGLPKSFLNRFSRVKVEAFSRSDLVGITTALCPEFDESILESMIDYVCALQQEIMVRRSFGIRGSPWEFNLRDVLRWAKMMKRYGCIHNPENCASTLFFDRLRTSEDRMSAVALFQQVTKRTVPPLRPVSFALRGCDICADGVAIYTRIESDAPVTVTNDKYLLLPSQSTTVRSILICAENNQFCLLTGSSGSGKTSSLHSAAGLANVKLVTFSITSSCDTVDLLGGFDQVEGKQGHFEWRDSVLLEAMICGDWLVLDNANFCNASVLDRLNPLVEPNGYLAVNEQGLVNGTTRVVRPHPSFRLFATMDPKYGEISRAMRNRATEVFVMGLPVPSIEASIVASARLKGALVSETTGAVEAVERFHSTFLKEAHHADSKKFGSAQLMDCLAAGAPNLYTLTKTVDMFDNTDKSVLSLFHSVFQRYLRNRTGAWLAVKQRLMEEIEVVKSTNLRDGLQVTKILAASKLNIDVPLCAALDVLRINRSALHFLKVSRLDEAEAAAALLFFLMDQCNDFTPSSTMASERLRLAEEFIQFVAPKVPFGDVAAIDKIGCHFPETASVLAMRLEGLVGQNRRWFRETSHQSASITDSAVVNAATSRLLAALQHFVVHCVDAEGFAATCRFGHVLVLGLMSDEESISPTHFLHVVTSLMLLKTTLERRGLSGTVHGCELHSSCEVLLSALQRYLGLTSLSASVPTLLKRTPRPRITTQADRQLMQTVDAATQRYESRRSVHEVKMLPLWRWSSMHHELHMLVLMITAAASQCKEALVELKQCTSAYIHKFYTNVRLLTDMEVATWSLVLKLECATSPDLLSLLPHIACQVLFKLQDASSLFPATWANKAVEAICFAMQVPIADFGGSSSESPKLAAALTNFFGDVFESFDVASRWRQASLSEWLRVVQLCFKVDVSDVASRKEFTSSDRDILESRLQTNDARLAPLVPYFIQTLEVIVNGELFEGQLLLGVVKARASEPSSPIDPMFKWKLKLDRGLEEEKYWRATAAHFSRFEEMTFSPLSPQVTVAKAFASMHQQAAQRAKAKYIERPDPSGKQFVDLVKQMNQVITTVMSETRVGAMLPSCAKKARLESPADTAASLESWSDLIRQRCREIFQSFGGYEDFVLPFVDAALTSALAASAAACVEKANIRETKHKHALFSLPDTIRLLGFPSMSPIAIPHVSFDNVEHLQVHMTYLEACLSSLNIHSVYLNTDATVARRLFDCFRDVFASVEKLEEKERNADAMSVLYKEKAMLIEGDDEKRLRNLKEMFPSYEKEFVIEDEVEGDDDNVDDQSAGEPSLQLAERKARHARIIFKGRNGKTILTLVSAHSRFYERLAKHRAREQWQLQGNEIAAVFKEKFDALNVSLKHSGSGDASLCSMDMESSLVGGFLVRSSILSQSLTVSESASIEEKVQCGFNVFVDPEPSEVASCSKALMSLIGEAKRHLETYPDNPTLLRVVKIGSRLAALPSLSTPLMKVMTGCEILLRECYEWERNASREVSIIAHITALSAFILRWRRLELHCWPHVFTAKRSEFAAKAAMHWFQVKDMCDALMEGHVEVLVAMFQFASNYLWTSSLGEYGARLSLLKGFAYELLGYEGEPQQRAANLFLQLAAFFEQFNDLIQKELKKRIDPLEEDLVQFCKIMRWEDSTYYAIRSTTEKSHLKIARILGELEESLHFPAIKIIQAEEQRCEEDPSMGYAVAIPEPVGKQKKKKSKKNSAIAEAEVAATAPEPLWKSAAVDNCITFCTSGAEEVIERIGALQKPKVPQNQKIRALKTLFDVVEEAGVPHTSETKVSDWETLFASVTSIAGVELSFPAVDVSLASSRYYRFARNIQRMREAERTAHADLSGAQVKRGSGTCESLFSLATSTAEHLDLALKAQRALFLLRQVTTTVSEGTTKFVEYAASCFPLIFKSAVNINHFVAQLQWVLTNHVISTTSPDFATISAAVALLEEDGKAVWNYCTRHGDLAADGVPLPSEETDAAINHLRTVVASLRTLSSLRHKCIVTAATTLSETLELTIRSPKPTAAARALASSEQSPKRSKKESSWAASLNAALTKWEDLVATLQVVDDAPAVVADEESDAPAPTGEFAQGMQTLQTLYAATKDVYDVTVVCLRSAHCHMSVHDKLMMLERIDNIGKRASIMIGSITKCIDSVSHLGLVLARLFAIIFKKGFCKPEDEDEEEGEGEGEGQQDGTGMDDGQGEKDVTNEIENEDQLMNMKDKEEQQEQQNEKDDGDDKEDNAADVETDFKADKENRSDDEEEEGEDDESDKEMGDVDEMDAQERKKSKKDKDDGEMDDDEGEGQTEEVPEDDLAEENNKEDGDEETGGFANKEDEIKEGDEEGKDKNEKELIANDDQQFSDEGDDRSDGDDKDGSDEETDAENEEGEVDEERSEDENREGGSEEREGEDGDEKQDLQDGDEEAKGDAEEDEVSEHGSAEDEFDKNVFEGGQQDDKEGEEDTENKKDDKKKKKAPQDAAGAEEEQQGDEQEEDDAGRSWKKQEKNESSQRKDNSNQTKSQSNPYSAIKEALQRHQRRMQQLDLDKSVKVKEDATADKESKDAKDKQNDDDHIDEYEFDEGGEKQGLAATDELQAKPDEAEDESPQHNDSEPNDENEDVEEPDAPSDSNMKRKKLTEDIKQEDDESTETDEALKKKKVKSSKGKVQTKDDEEDVPAEPEATQEVESMDDKLKRGRTLWLQHESHVQGMAQQLCEQLRLILAPTVADKLQGDYKTGKRINIKKIIPYIASQYKKDRIWLRRTRPNKRTYQIVIALDDSLSMQVNDAGAVSLQSVALLSKAMQQLDVGEFGLISFGKEPKVVHPLAEPFGIESGPRAFSEITFQQTSTNMRAFLQFSLDYMDNERNRLGGQIRSTTQQLQQIMFVITDGQITEDRQELRKLLARAEENKQVVVLVILDIKATVGAAEGTDQLTEPKAPEAAVVHGKQSTAERMRQLKLEREKRLNRVQKSSILDMQLVEFEGNKVIKKSYLENFPFPFYLVIKNLPTLPEVLADAMRQWFELLNAH